MLARGRSDAPQVLFIPPLFEEMNYSRTLLGELGRALVGRGVATWLPDLPGTGESERALISVSWEEWRHAACAAGDAVAARTGRRPLTCAFRGGALLDDAVAAAAGRWRCAPVAGEALLRQMRRAQLVADRESGGVTADEAATVEWAGYALSLPLRAGLAAAEPAPVAHREAPMLRDGAPWRRAEPAGDVVLAQQLADDICDWIASCAS